MKTLAEHRAAVDAARQALDAGRRALLDADGRRHFSDTEHERREQQLRNAFRATIAEANEAAQAAIGDGRGGLRRHAMTAGDRGKRGADAPIIAALAAGASVPAAARVGGVSEPTVYRRLREPGFRKRVDDARAEIVARAIAKLSAASTEAVTTLRRLLYVDSDFVRLGAAKSILDLGVRLREHEDLAARVEALEAQLAPAEHGRTRRWRG